MVVILIEIKNFYKFNIRKIVIFYFVLSLGKKKYLIWNTLQKYNEIIMTPIH